MATTVTKVIVRPKRTVVVIRKGGPQGEPGPLPTINYHHVQIAPAQVWTVQHNLGRNPVNVRIVSDNGDEYEEASRTYVNSNVMLLTFIDPLAGTADVS